MKRKIYRTRLGEAMPRRLRENRGTTTPIVDAERGPAHNIDLHLNVLEPGSGPGPTHFHRVAENLYWVLEGSITVEAGNEKHVLDAGDVLLIPPGIVHATMNLTDEPARFVELYAPSGSDFHIVTKDNGAEENQ